MKKTPQGSQFAGAPSPPYTMLSLPLPPIYNAENILTENNSMAQTWTASITLKAKNLILLKKNSIVYGGRGRAANVFFIQILCQILRPRLSEILFL